MLSESALSKNINDEFVIAKPARQSYIKNGAHKKFSKQKYFEINQRWEHVTMNDKGEKSSNVDYDACQKFNFKKTNGRKYKYSCGGYGGKCSMCKSGGYEDGKKYRKVTIGNTGSDFTMTLNTRTHKN